MSTLQDILMIYQEIYFAQIPVKLGKIANF